MVSKPVHQFVAIELDANVSIGHSYCFVNEQLLCDRTVLQCERSGNEGKFSWLVFKWAYKVDEKAMIRNRYKPLYCRILYKMQFVKQK